MAAKAAKSKAKSSRGGSRTGAGRKPKAITEMREALIAPMRPPEGPAADVIPMPAACDRAAAMERRKTAAEFALALFEKTMRDEGKPIDLRLDCAKEVMNRSIGKPRIAEAPKGDAEDGEQVHIYMPDNGRGVAAG